MALIAAQDRKKISSRTSPAPGCALSHRSGSSQSATGVLLSPGQHRPVHGILILPPTVLEYQVFTAVVSLFPRTGRLGGHLQCHPSLVPHISAGLHFAPPAAVPLHEKTHREASSKQCQRFPLPALRRFLVGYPHRFARGFPGRHLAKWLEPLDLAFHHPVRLPVGVGRPSHCGSGAPSYPGTGDRLGRIPGFLHGNGHAQWPRDRSLDRARGIGHRPAVHQG